MKLTTPDKPARRAKERLARPLVYLEGGVIRFAQCHSYGIDFMSIATPERALGWIAHLCAKRWVTTRTLETLVAVLEQQGVSVQR